MLNLFSLMYPVALIAFIVGLIKPSIFHFIFRSYTSRKIEAIVFGGIFLISFSAVAILNPSKPETRIADQHTITNTPTRTVTSKPTSVAQKKLTVQIPHPTAKTQQTPRSNADTYDSNGFPSNAKHVTVSAIAKTPSDYADGVTNVVFTCKIINFARNAQGDAAAANCSDPNDLSSVLQIDIGNFDVKRINVGDSINIWGFVTGVGKGKNAYGAYVTEPLVSGMAINDMTNGYNTAK